TPVPMARAIALDLELLGGHGMAAHSYPPVLELVRAGRLRPDLLVTRALGLHAAPAALAALAALDTAPGPGVPVVAPRMPTPTPPPTPPPMPTPTPTGTPTQPTPGPALP